MISAYIYIIPYTMTFDGTRACIHESYRLIDLIEVNPATLPPHHRLKTNAPAVLRLFFKKLFGNGRCVEVDETITTIALGLKIHG